MKVLKGNQQRRRYEKDSGHDEGIVGKVCIILVYLDVERAHNERFHKNNMNVDFRRVASELGFVGRSTKTQRR